MTITVQSNSALPAAAQNYPKITGVVRSNNSQNIYPIGLTKDKLWFLACSQVSTNPALYYSADGGATWNTLYTFPTGGVTDFIETGDGECLVFLSAGGGTPGYIYKSTGWAANKLTATWALVFTTTGGRFNSFYSPTKTAFDSTGFGVICEYGVQTVAGATSGSAQYGIRAYRSFNWGNTWEVFYNQLGDSTALVQPPNVAGTHLHSITYDKWDDRVYLTYGDNSGSGPALYGATNYQIMYTENAKAANVADIVWTHWPIAGDFAGLPLQVTTILPTPKHILFATDGQPYAICRFPRLGYRQLGNFEAMAMLTNSASGGISGRSLWQNVGDDNAPIFSGNFLNTQGDLQERIMCSPDQGSSWFEILGPYTGEPMITQSNNCAAFGPDSSGRVLGISGYNNGGAWANGSIWRGVLSFG